MVLLTVTVAAKDAIDEFRSSKLNNNDGAGPEIQEISSHLVRRSRQNGDDLKRWRLDSLLKGASVYQPPPPSKPEPTSEYKALMKRLRQDEEQRQYERMLNPQGQHETYRPISSSGMHSFNPATSIGQGPDFKEVDEVTFADVNRQMALIINVLVSIIACSVAIWIAARRWSVPQRLGLSLSGSGLVAAAEVAIYMGYIRRIKDAKSLEKKVVESKEIVESWVLDGSTATKEITAGDAMRYRKGKHR